MSKCYMHIYASTKTKLRVRKIARFLKISQEQLVNQALDLLEASDPELFKYYKEQEMQEDDTT